MTYRKDIDFLRALAMIGIFLYHLSLPGLSGGYVFLELFFVISGYLISNIIIAKIQAGKFSIKSFYINRFFRLFPALITTIMFTVAAGFFILSPAHFKELSGAAVAAIFSVSNFLFWMQVDYFDIGKYLKPLLHTWSLGVEEQFYLIWPALLVFIFSFRRTIRTYYIVITTLFCLSLSLSILWSYDETMKSGAYYLLPSRMFEFTLGALIASLGPFGHRTEKLGRALSEALFAGGLILIFVAVFTFEESDAFPGYIALLPCFGAMLCLIGGAKSMLAHILSHRSSVYIGQISYSLYLVHWPLIVYYKYTHDGPLSYGDMALIMGIAIGLASALHICVEQPFRQKTGPIKQLKRLNIPRKAGAYSCLTCVALTSLACASIYATDGFNARLNSNVQLLFSEVEFDYNKRQTAIRAPDCHFNNVSESIEDYLSRFEMCNPRERLESSAYNILLIGDSHGADIYAALSYARPDVNVIQLTKAGCYVEPDLIGAGHNCSQMHLFARDYLAEHADKIDGVIFKIRGEILTTKDNGAFSGLRQFLITPAKAYLESLQALGVPVIWIGPNVEFSKDFRQFVEASESLEDAISQAKNSHKWPEIDAIDAQLTFEFKNSPVSYISMRELCGGTCPLLTDEEFPVTPDYGHWGYRGAQHMSRYVTAAPEVKAAIGE